jgi:hypothetical protein
MTIKLLFNPKKGKVLTGVSQHACMVKSKEFDSMVRAIYFQDKNVLYFRFYDPTGEYANLASWAYARSRNVCERALKAFIDREMVPSNVRPLYWETGHGVTDLDIKY